VSLGYGGGAYSGTLNNCTLSGNSAAVTGGGAHWATLNNCTVVGNSANYRGGADGCRLTNCIVYYNSAALSDPNCDNSCILHYSCTTPLLAGGIGSVSSPPLFVDYAGGDLRLQSNSPCINAGDNAYVVGATDLDGDSRISGATVDMGAYEFPSPASILSYAWLQSYGLPTDGSVDYADSDADGMNNWQEWCCRTDPTNALSALRMVSATPAGTNVLVSWQSVAGVTYHLVRSTNLWEWPAFGLLETNLVGQAGTTTYTDTNWAQLARLFYRVGVGDYLGTIAPPTPTPEGPFHDAAQTRRLNWPRTDDYEP
jgi:hypothetical protein